MHIIDQYAYSNRIRGVNPSHKFGLAFGVLLLCLLLNKPLVGIAAVGWMFLLGVKVAGLSARTFGRVLLAEAAFLTLTTIGVILSISLSDPRQISPWAVNVGPLWLSTSPDALYLGVSLITRALGAASAMNFLALTTPLVDMVELFRRWHIPSELIDIMTVIYRFVFVLLESLGRMQMAQESRLGYNTTHFRTMNSAAMLGSQLFIDAFQRSKRLQIALESRGFDGDLKVLPAHYATERKLLWIGSGAIISLILIWLLV